MRYLRNHLVALLAVLLYLCCNPCGAAAQTLVPDADSTISEQRTDTLLLNVLNDYYPTIIEYTRISYVVPEINSAVTLKLTRYTYKAPVAVDRKEFRYALLSAWLRQQLNAQHDAALRLGMLRAPASNESIILSPSWMASDNDDVHEENATECNNCQPNMVTISPNGEISITPGNANGTTDTQSEWRIAP